LNKEYTISISVTRFLCLKEPCGSYYIVCSFCSLEIIVVVGVQLNFSKHNTENSENSIQDLFNFSRLFNIQKKIVPKEN